MHPQLFSATELESKTPYSLTPDQAHHLHRVCKLSPGDILDIVTPTQRHTVTITHITKKNVAYTPLTTHPIQAPRYRITLLQALPKQDKFTDILRKCTEIGIHDIVPLITERCQNHHTLKTQSEGRIERWKNTLTSAAEQCKRDTIPILHPIQTLDEYLASPQNTHNLKIACWESEKDQTLKSLLKRELEQKKEDITTPAYALLIGPEGGISDQEISRLKQSGFESVSISNTILRVENAAFLAIANIAYEIPPGNPQTIS